MVNNLSFFLTNVGIIKDWIITYMYEYFGAVTRILVSEA